MAFDIDQLIKLINNQLDVFDIPGAEQSCDGFINYLVESDDAVDLRKAGVILQLFRRKRMFLQMQQIADALIQSGRTNFTIQKLYAQAMVDSGNFTCAIATLRWLIVETEAVMRQDAMALKENLEAKGLLGRVYKQLYVNANKPRNRQSIGHMAASIKAYYDVYSAYKDKFWHGINAAAMVERAKRDGVPLKDLPDSQLIAKEIIEAIKKIAEPGYWDYATIAEAFLVLNEPVEALRWLVDYSNLSECDAFELGSTLRQLEEVWQLDLTTTTGQLLLPILRAGFTKRKGSHLVVDGETARKQGEILDTIEKKYESLAEQQLIGQEGNISHERVHGTESFNSFRWYTKGVDRSRLVARIGRDSGSGLGTGFLLPGNLLKQKLGKQKYLLTNAHVVGKSRQYAALLPEEAVVIFEALDGSEEFRNLEIVWTSPVDKLDATLLKFSDDDQKRIDRLTKRVIHYQISKNLPQLPLDEPPTQKIYIIGHPNGGSQQFSLYDNLLIDYQTPRLHYRTPTTRGSSGSPVFNDQWELIGLHHAGLKDMPRLNDKPGTYSANEGIWIQSIIDAI